MAFNFQNNVLQVTEMLQEEAVKFLHEQASELVAQVVRNNDPYVDTGQLKGSWKYTIDEQALKATIGSPLQNAIWEEFGTGEYAVNGHGRKKPWRYQDLKGNWHYTRGKKPRRALERAIETRKPEIKRRLEEIIGGN